MTKPIARYMRRDEAAQYLRDVHRQEMSKSTLAYMASVGGGPAFRKSGRYPLYTQEDLDLWAEQRMSPRVHSTTELRQHRSQQSGAEAREGAQ